jgi:hypothetical protein
MPVAGSTVATVPVASTLAPPPGTELLAGDVFSLEDVASSPRTWMLFATRLTPSTPRAICARGFITMFSLRRLRPADNLEALTHDDPERRPGQGADSGAWRHRAARRHADDDLVTRPELREGHRPAVERRLHARTELDDPAVAQHDA